MSRNAIPAQRHILRALSLWPTDTVRPGIQFADVLKKRFEAASGSSSPSRSSSQAPTNTSTSTTATTQPQGEAAAHTAAVSAKASSLYQASEQDLLKQANALYGLLGDRFKKRYPTANGILEPKSKPTHFTDLVRELEEGPKRSAFERFMVRMKGMVRYQ